MSVYLELKTNNGGEKQRNYAVKERKLKIL